MIDVTIDGLQHTFKRDIFLFDLILSSILVSKTKQEVQCWCPDSTYIGARSVLSFIISEARLWFAWMFSTVGAAS